MSSKKRMIAVALAGVLLLSSVAAADVARSATANDSLDVDVENTGNDGAIVTVTENDSAVEDASVTVNVTDENDTYEGAGDYTTDENGTVDLPEPEEDVTVEITAETSDAAGSTTTELTADEGDEQSGFGQMVSSFVNDMLDAGKDGGPLGQAVSDFVTSNNPGADKKPDDAGKPDNVGAQNGTAENGTDGGSQGPPEQAGGEKNDSDAKGNGR